METTPWIPAAVSVVVAVLAAITSLMANKGSAEGDFRDDYLERLRAAEARADSAIERADDLLARQIMLEQENAALRIQILTMQAHIKRLEERGP